MSRRRPSWPESWWHEPRPTMSARRAAAEKQARKLEKKGSLEPVTVQGNKIALSWWGKSWNDNLQRYADYSNRLGRGRSYVRNGMVLDLQIKPGLVEAIVAGSRSTPYAVAIRLRPLGPKVQNSLARETAGQIPSVEALLKGEFPESMRQLLFRVENGLFPHPRDLKFSCTCPDWASMCKHVAAALLGVGARLDQKPELFFVLRSIDPEQLAARALQAESKRLIKQTPAKSSRVLQGADLHQLFGIEVSGRKR